MAQDFRAELEAWLAAQGAQNAPSRGAVQQVKPPTQSRTRKALEDAVNRGVMTSIMKREQAKQSAMDAQILRRIQVQKMAQMLEANERAQAGKPSVRVGPTTIMQGQGAKPRVNVGVGPVQMQPMPQQAPMQLAPMHVQIPGNAWTPNMQTAPSPFPR